MTYRRRVIDEQLDVLLPDIRAFLIDGPKGVGKTETALQRSTTVFRLDDPTDLQVVTASPALALKRPGIVLIDEWQRMPSIWDSVKRAVDAKTPDQGPFLLTGSPYLPNIVTHSGAGRIHELRMRPMTLPERGVVKPTVSFGELLYAGATISGTNMNFKLEDYVEEIVASGFPGIRTLSPIARQAQLNSYLKSIVQKDMKEAGLNLRKPEALTSWLRSYAAATSTTSTWETIRNASSPGERTPARSTIKPYIEVLQMLRIVDEVPAWLPGNNRFQSLVQAPKHHLVDPALAARISGMTIKKLVTSGGVKGVLPIDGTFLGALFESLVTLTVRVFAQNYNAQVFHLRTREGRQEVDLIIESEDGQILGIEVKLSPTVKDDDVKHLLWLKNNAKAKISDLVVITTGDTAYRRTDGIAVVPLSLLGL